MIDLSDPDDPTAAGSIGDTPFRNLGGAIDIATFESGNATYAAVASSVDDGVQVIDLSDPYSPAAAGGIGDTPFRNLEGANGIATFESGTTTYAAVTSYFDDGIQVIKLNTSPAAYAGSDQTVNENTTVTLSGTAVDDDGNTLTYLWAQYSNLPISITNDTALSTDFTVPLVNANTTVTFTLAVFDGITTATDTAAVTIIDVVPNTTPAITITGFNPASINVGRYYADEGATCTDPEDGDLDATVVSNTVNTHSTGSYRIIYSCTDSAGHTVNRHNP